MDELAKGSDGESDCTANHKPGRLMSRVRRSSKGNWTEEEDVVLQDAVQRYGGKSWKKVANCLSGRTDTQCLHRWQKVLNPNVVKGPWSKEEDELLVKLVEKQSEKKMKWAEIAAQLPGRMGKQCRERWHNHLNPEINKAAWTKEEEKILINAHRMCGNKWSEIAKILPGRTENSVKNHWNCSLKRKLLNSSSSSSALDDPQIVTHLNGEEKQVEFDQTLISPRSSLHREKRADDKTEDSLALDLSLRVSSSHPPSSGKTDPSRNSEMPLHCSDFSTSCSSNPRRHSDTHGRRYQNLQSDSSYSGLCYEPVQMADMNVTLSTDSYISQPSSSPNSILRIAAMSYDKMPSIIRKRGVKSSVNDVSSPGNQKLGKSEVIRSVGKCLEPEFSDALKSGKGLMN